MKLFQASKFFFQYLYFYGTTQNLQAKYELEEEIRLSRVNGAFSNSFIHASWETESITANQLKQNIGLALSCIFIVAVVMLADILLSLMIFCTVTITLVDIVGFLYFWNISIDFIVCTYVVISIGLCVDYAFHIGHAYLIQEGFVLLLKVTIQASSIII